MRMLACASDAGITDLTPSVWERGHHLIPPSCTRRHMQKEAAVAHKVVRLASQGQLHPTAAYAHVRGLMPPKHVFSIIVHASARVVPVRTELIHCHPTLRS